MKKFKQLLALVMAVTMLSGIVPANTMPVEAMSWKPTQEEQMQEQVQTLELNTGVETSSDTESEVVEAAVFFSDLHSSASDSKTNTTKTIMGSVAKSGNSISSVTSVGDVFSSNNSNNFGSLSTITNNILTGLGDSSIPVFYAWSDHDRNTSIEDYTGLLYGAGDDGIYGNADDDNYYIYTISMSDTSTNDRYNTGVFGLEQSTLDSFTADVEKLDQSKPLFIASHQPLLDRRNDNGNAYAWYQVISKAAEKMDIVFLFGHNHKYDEETDYFYTKDDTMSVCTDSKGNSTNVVLNFTHACAGYMAPSSTGSTSDTTREGTVVLAEIYDESIRLVTYDKNGVYTGNYAIDETVARKHAVTEPEVVPIDKTALETAITKAEKLVAEDYIDFTAVTEALAAAKTALADENITQETVDEAAKALEAAVAALEAKPEDTGIPEGYVLSSLVVSDEIKTNYFVGEEFDMNSLKVQAVYGKEGNEDIICDIAIAGENEDGYTVSEVDTAVAGTYTVTVSYEGITTSFDIEVFEKVVSDSNTGISIETTVAGAVEISVNTVDTTNEVIAAAVSEVLENYVGYDIKLDGHNTGDVVKVTLPVPEGVTNPKVYYVSDDGSTVTNMNAVKSEDGKTVTFETDHFSVYLVGEGLGIEIPEAVVATGQVNKTTVNKKTVYVQKSTLTSGNSYLIVNSNSAGNTNRYALSNTNGEIASTEVQIKSGSINGSTRTYIELNDATDELWTMTGSNNQYTIQNKDNYLNYTRSGNSYTLDLSSESRSWQWDGSSNRFSITDRYLTYDSGWTLGRWFSSVYLYEPLTIETEVTTLVSGTYRITGTPAAVTKPAIAGTQITLGSAVTYKYDVDGSSVNVNTNSANLKYEVYEDSYGVISGEVSGNTVTLSGKTGEALVKVSYTDTDDAGNNYTVSNYILITAETPVYKVKVDPLENYMIKVGSTTEPLSVKTTLNDEEFEPAAGTITWSSENSTIATVDPTTGVVTAIASGSVNIIATYTDPNGNTHTDVVPLEVAESVYTLNLHYAEIEVDAEGNVINAVPGKEITESIAIKDVVAGQTYTNIWAVITKDGKDMEQLLPEELEKLSFVSSNEEVATVDSKTGIVTFVGNTGRVVITVGYEYEEGKSVTDTVIFSVSDDHYYVPEDGTDDFPEYPNEGSVRFDKTATAVGTFSQTGIAKLELSMTGVPFTEGNRMDVVLMLDRSSSMYKSGVQHRISSTVEAAKVFVKNIVMNEDGSFNNNRIMVLDFLGGNLDSSEGGGSKHQYESNLYTTNEENGYQVINNQAELDVLLTKIETDFKGQTSLYGTEYAQGLEECYNALHASKDDGNKQFCVFMSDGIPNYMMGEKTHFKKTDDIVAMFDVSNYNSDNATAARNATKYEYEYYSTQMKNEGVTVFTVGLGLKNTNSAWDKATATACEQVANMLLNDISGPAGEKAADRDIGSAVSKLDKYFYSVADENAAENMKDVFAGIAQKIHEAAKDVKVTDKIADDYTMIFDFPNVEVKNDYNDPEQNNPKQDFYIEVNEYQLNPKYGTGVSANEIVDYTRGNSNSLLKLYLGKDATGKYFAAKDSEGTPHAAPTFTATPIGTKLYWTTDATKADSSVPVSVPALDSNGAPVLDENEKPIVYYFVSAGNGEYNLTSGAYVSGTPATETVGSETVDKPCQNLVIATQYFVYDAATRMLVWTAEKLSSTELALTYFLYLNNSGGFVGTLEEAVEGTYPTNDYANLNYTNHKDNECEQIFPVPQMTWNGAQVSYVFYLVNEDGVPVNRAGRQIPFSEAVYVTDVYTYSKIWNKNDVDGNLEATYLAEDLVPEVYELFDKQAKYLINVYENENGVDKNNHFVIGGNESLVDTTYVFNTKADSTKYTELKSYDKNDVHTGFDFSNTTVAFAVVWKPRLAEDVVVIDYGLPVNINVAMNDNVEGVVTGVSGANNASLLDTKINTGQIVNHLRFPTEIEPDQFENVKYGKAEVINSTSVRYTPLTMSMNDAEKFYYISSLEYYDSNNLKVTSRMYSSVTVIPATTIYYEDSFVAYNNGGSVQSGLTETDIAHGEWTTAGTVQTGVTQAQDRPGPDKISAALDADNVYGYDQAYMNCTEYSLGSAQKVTVSTYNNPIAKYHPEDANKEATASWPSATFTFTGAGFDIISLTSRETGLIKVDVTGTETHSWLVDTYYGYNYNAETEEWEVSEGTTPNDLYQIPVIKSGNELQYGTYTVTITPMYSSGFDHAGSGSYDFYLDAIRIYDPANDGANNKEIADAYKADKEGWPAYTEVRNMLIAKEDFYTADGTTKGIIFIDGIPALDDSIESAVSDYTYYGPNNEVYLAPGQAIAFKLNLGNSDIADVQLAVKSINGEVSYKIYDAGTTDITRVKSKTVKTATDLYESVTLYDKQIEELNGKTIVIANDSPTEGSVLSITNIKVTFNTAPGTELDLSELVEVDQEVAQIAMFSLRRPVVEDLPTEDDTTSDDVIKDDTTTDDDKEEIDTPSGNPTISNIAHSIIRDIVDTVKWLKNFFKR